MKAAVATVIVVACVLGFLFVASPSYMGGYQPSLPEILWGALIAVLPPGGLPLALLVSGSILILTGLAAAVLDRPGHRV